MEDLHPDVRAVLALKSGGQAQMPLVCRRSHEDEAARLVQKLNYKSAFENARSPAGAMGGLLLYCSCFDECHRLVQDLNTKEGSLWHGILHRQEPDAANARYWFRQAGAHPIFDELNAQASALAGEAVEAGYTPGARWEPGAFVEFCERVRRQPGSAAEALALRIQLAEWQLLFSWCAAVRR